MPVVCGCLNSNGSKTPAFGYRTCLVVRSMKDRPIIAFIRCHRAGAQSLAPSPRLVRISLPRVLAGQLVVCSSRYCHFIFLPIPFDIPYFCLLLVYIYKSSCYRYLGISFGLLRKLEIWTFIFRPGFLLGSIINMEIYLLLS